MRFPRQATFNIMKYMFGLAEAFQRDGGKFFQARVTDVKGGGRAAHLKTESGFTVDATSIVVATNYPINGSLSTHAKQAAYRSYVIGFEIAKNSYTPFLLWDMAKPYHYVRIVHARTGDILIVGGEDHRTGQADDADKRYAALQKWAAHHFSGLGNIKFRWSGQIIEPEDSLAFIGRKSNDEKNIYLATGDSGHGMTHGTIAGILISDLIDGRENAWEKLYCPSRVTLKATPSYVKENSCTVGYMIKDKLTSGEVDKVEDIQLGEGAIVGRGNHKIAVYKDAKGIVSECSAVCTHLGCIVHWNGNEKSWDCPCHGSRFAPNGQVLNGPAVLPLKKPDAEDKK